MKCVVYPDTCFNLDLTETREILHKIRKYKKNRIVYLIKCVKFFIKKIMQLDEASVASPRGGEGGQKRNMISFGESIGTLDPKSEYNPAPEIGDFAPRSLAHVKIWSVGVVRYGRKDLDAEAKKSAEWHRINGVRPPPPPAWKKRPFLFVLQRKLDFSPRPQRGISGLKNCLSVSQQTSF